MPIMDGVQWGNWRAFLQGDLGVFFLEEKCLGVWRLYMCHITKGDEERDTWDNHYHYLAKRD